MGDILVQALILKKTQPKHQTKKKNPKPKIFFDLHIAFWVLSSHTDFCWAKLSTYFARPNLSLGQITEENHIYDFKSNISFLFTTPLKQLL